MKKVMIIVAFGVAALMGLIVTGCSQDNNKEKLICYGKSNEQLICECALELQSLITTWGNNSVCHRQRYEL